VRVLKEFIAEEHRRGATILFSTHVMVHAEELRQHVVMIHRGRKVLDEPMAGLRRQYNRGVIQVAEAQSLMGPVMLMLMLPYIRSPMIGRAKSMDALPFPLARLAENRSKVCDYCFFGGPTKTVPLVT
jgi:hypothetical protein